MTIATPPKLQPVTMGPTWQRGPDGKFVLPKLTLGWDVLGWTAEYLQLPDGPDAGEPWGYTNEQARFVLWWYAVNELGRFIYRDGLFRRMKGHGKDPLGATLCAVEFVGPCRFGGWKKDGTPHVVPHPAAWVQTAAVSKDQTRNTMTLFPGLFSKRAIEDYQIDLGKEIIYAERGRKRIEAVTSSPRALEGGRGTFVLKNEPHHWIQSNEGIEMDRVIGRNAAKSRDGSSRALGISNAHAPGEGSVAEAYYEAALLGSADLLYDSLEAPEIDMDDPELLSAAVDLCRGDSAWLDVDRLVAEIQDPRTPRNMSRRFYLNQVAAGDDRAFSRERIIAHANPHVVPDGALIGLGFDGSKNRDHTALIGTEFTTGYQWIVGYWEPRMKDDGTVEIPVDEVNATVDDAFTRWNVWRLYGDPWYWRQEMSQWAGKYDRPGEPRVVEYDTTQYKRMAKALLAYKEGMDDGEWSYDGDERFTSAFVHAYRRVMQFVDDNGERMWIIQKERPDSPLKIDAAMAGCLSWEVYLHGLAEGVLTVPEDTFEVYEVNV